MATVTKPIALDESLNTTESPSRNVADVLAQELSAVATAIGGIAVPSADHVSYDNSVSGLSATDVQNALDEIVSDIPTVNNGTLTIQQNGTSIGSFSANTASNVTANIKTPTADKKTATGEFNTADGGLFSKCQINLVPVQSGSGDPSPDNVRPISGHTEVDLINDGKNKLPFHIDNVKGNNLSGTWSGCIYTYKNVDWIFDVDAKGYIQKVTANGLASAESNITVLINDYIKANTLFKYNGVPTGGGSATYQAFIRGGGYDRGSGNATTPTQANIDNDYYWYRITIANGYNAQNVVFYPMIYVGDDSTYEPYNGHLYQVQIGQTVYGGHVDLVSGVMTVDRGYLDASSITWTPQTNSRWFYNGLTAVIKLPPNNATPTETISDRFVAMSNDNMASTTNIGLSVNNSGSLIIRNGSTTIQPEGQVVYPLATPFTIQLTPQQIEALVGQNNLSTPLSGQSIETNGVEYKELFTFADVKSYVDKKIPDAPTTDGTYTLQAVVSGGVPTYSWT